MFRPNNSPKRILICTERCSHCCNLILLTKRNKNTKLRSFLTTNNFLAIIGFSTILKYVFIYYFF